jgi:hypothetical protein
VRVEINGETSEVTKGTKEAALTWHKLVGFGEELAMVRAPG